MSSIFWIEKYYQRFISKKYLQDNKSFCLIVHDISCIHGNCYWVYDNNLQWWGTKTFFIIWTGFFMCLLLDYLSKGGNQHFRYYPLSAPKRSEWPGQYICWPGHSNRFVNVNSIITSSFIVSVSSSRFMNFEQYALINAYL